MPKSSPHPAYRLGALILAAGKGTRMYSHLPKVLQPLLNEPMLRYVFTATESVCADNIWTVIGYQAALIQETFTHKDPVFILQKEQLGTGHALQTAWPHLVAANISHVLVINGDTPLISAHALDELTKRTLKENLDLAFITLSLDDPGSYGRVLRQQGKVQAIIEAKDYSPTTHGPEPREINAGIYCLRVDAISPLLDKLVPSPISNEYYITDLIGLAVAHSLKIEGINLGNDHSLLGVNTPAELVRSEELLRQRIIAQHQANCVFLHQPDSLRIGPFVTLAPGVRITGPCEIYGTSSIGTGTIIDSHTVIHNSYIDEYAHIRSFSHLDSCRIAARTIIGPYARLRPGTVLEEEVHVGNFVEIKNSLLHKGVKSGHLSYLGDAEIEEHVNIGAGTITCNYDGTNKHATHIGKNAFIGSNTSLVAPVSIGENAVVGAGSVITKNVSANSLAIGRSRQVQLVRKGTHRK